MAAEKRTTAKTKTTKPKTTTTRTRKQRVIPSVEQIAERAYFIHLDEGGDAFTNWIRAEHELATI